MNRRNFIGTIGAATIAAKTSLAGNAESRDTVFQPLKNLIANKEPVIWVFTGDSITHGALHTFGWRSYVEHFAERVRFEMRRMTDVIINTGISGDTMKGILARADWRIFQFKPQVVSLKIGMNDCREAEKGREFFKESLETLIEKAEKQKAILLLNTPNLIEFANAKERIALPRYVEIIREIAVKYKLPLVDHYAHWTKETGTGARLQMWLNDGSIHPNNFGHIVLARKIFQDLGIFDPNSITCGRLFVP
jgi:lysophospholipase L1-like esterase